MKVGSIPTKITTDSTSLRCYLDACNVTDVLTAAVEYGIEDLKKLCIDFFKSTLTVDTVCEALQAALSYNNSDLKKTCLGFVERNTLVSICKSVCNTYFGKYL